jgi:translation elongation factor EF-G
VLVSAPITLFHESVEAASKPHSATSTNGKNEITVRVEPMLPHDSEILKAAKLGGDRRGMTTHAKDMLKQAGLSWTEREVDGLIDAGGCVMPVICMLPKNQKMSTLSVADETVIIDAVASISKHGPLVKEPVSYVKVIFEKVAFSSHPEDFDTIEITPMIRQAVFDAMNETGVVLLEPIFESTVYGAMENIGKLTSLITQHGGRVEAMEQDGGAAKLRAYFPVRESFGLIEEARNMTSGRAVFQNAFAGFEKIQKGMIHGILADLKAKKGIV